MDKKLANAMIEAARELRALVREIGTREPALAGQATRTAYALERLSETIERQRLDEDRGR